MTTQDALFNPDAFASTKARLAAVRWPLQPLLDALHPDDRVTPSASLRALRCSLDAYEKAKESGLTDRMADKLACRIGKHPASVWPTWFDVVLDTPETTEAAA